jgi:hypothetical protein
MTQGIALRWLAASAETATANDFDKHMDLISRRVNLSGMPGHDNIGYDQWAAQCEHEFSNHEIASVHYEGLRMLVSTPRRVMFKTWETVEATDGEVNAHGIEVLLEMEDDGKWRLLQERVLDDEEARHDGLIPL